MSAKEHYPVSHAYYNQPNAHLIATRTGLRTIQHKTIEDVKEKTDKVKSKLEIVESHLMLEMVNDDTMTLLRQCQNELTELEKLKI